MPRLLFSCVVQSTFDVVKPVASRKKFFKSTLLDSNMFLFVSKKVAVLRVFTTSNVYRKLTVPGDQRALSHCNFVSSKTRTRIVLTLLMFEEEKEEEEEEEEE